MLDWIKEMIWGKVVDEDLDSLTNYNNLNYTERKKTSELHSVIKGQVTERFNKIAVHDTYTPQELLSECRYKDEVVQGKPLQLVKHALMSGDELTHEGFGTKLFRTGKRLYLVNTGVGKFPNVWKEFSTINIRNIAEDRLGVISIPFRHITHVAVNMRNSVIGKATIRRFIMWPVSVIGVLILLWKVFEYLQRPRDLRVALVVGGVLIVLGLLVSIYSKSEDGVVHDEYKELWLSCREPFYGTGALLKCRIDTAEHTVPEILKFVRDVQEKM